MFENQFNDIFKNKTVLLTGHTGFKGSWLTLWLSKLGANVIGYSKDFPTVPNHFELLNLSEKCTSIIGNINDKDHLKEVFEKYKPEIVFHLAAQSVVGYSYRNPIETFESNIMGTINVFECVRSSESVQAIVNVTSDKCYQNDEQNIAFTESFPMGGNDPYSCSKGAAELITNCYRNSFFDDKNIFLGSARAGTVIGGGDWTMDALIPDVVKAISIEEKMIIRSPYATRPWQFVLEPLSGYLLLAKKLLEKGNSYSEGWNFGPVSIESFNVLDLLNLLKNNWSKIQFSYNQQIDFYKEAKYLRLDCTKAVQKMNWKPVWTVQKAIEKTAEWYKMYYEEDVVLTEDHLQEYIKDAVLLGHEWAS